MKKLLSIVLAVVVMLPAVFVSADYYGYGQNYYNGYGDASFYDVPNSYPYYDSIYWMRDNQFVSGYADGNFRPDICVNRAEFLKMMFEVANTEDDIFDYPYYNTVHYSDVRTWDWFYPYVAEATYEGVVRGYEDGSFKPGNCVTRAEAVKVASLYFNDGDLPEIDNYEFRIADNNFRKWYFPFVDYASRSNTVGLYHAIPAGEIQGDDAYFYLPEESMTRGEVAEMLYRLEYITDRNDEVYEGGRRDGSNSGNSSDEVSCRVDLNTYRFYPFHENLEIDYLIGRYEDDRVRAEIKVEFPNGDELELRDSSVDSNNDYQYYWDGEDTDGEYIGDGRYEVQLRVRDRDSGRTICTDSEDFVVDADIVDDSNDSDSDSDEDGDDYYYYSDDDTTNNYDYYYYYYYTTNNYITEDSDDTVVSACDLSVSTTNYDPSAGNLVINYGLGDYSKATLDTELRFEGIGLPPFTLVDTELAINSNHVLDWTGDVGGTLVRDGTYDVKLELRDTDTDVLVCTAELRMVVQD